MGNILRGRCTCGFDTGDVFAGGGFMTYTDICNAPAICPECNEFLVRNYLKKEITLCPGCHGKVTFYDDPSLHVPAPRVEGNGYLFTWKLAGKEGHFKLPRTSFFCPVCKQMTLVFEDKGSWS
jgi:hypothetical protein